MIRIKEISKISYINDYLREKNRINNKNLFIEKNGSIGQDIL